MTPIVQVPIRIRILLSLLIIAIRIRSLPPLPRARQLQPVERRSIRIWFSGRAVNPVYRIFWSGKVPMPNCMCVTCCGPTLRMRRPGSRPSSGTPPGNGILGDATTTTQPRTRMRWRRSRTRTKERTKRRDGIKRERLQDYSTNKLLIGITTTLSNERFQERLTNTSCSFFLPSFRFIDCYTQGNFRFDSWLLLLLFFGGCCFKTNIVYFFLVLFSPTTCSLLYLPYAGCVLRGDRRWNSNPRNLPNKTNGKF